MYVTREGEVWGRLEATGIGEMKLSVVTVPPHATDNKGYVLLDGDDQRIEEYTDKEQAVKALMAEDDDNARIMITKEIDQHAQ